MPRHGCLKWMDAMNNTTLIDLDAYRDEDHGCETSADANHNSISDDLATAIQALIQRLRDANPLR